MAAKKLNENDFREVAQLLHTLLATMAEIRDNVSKPLSTLASFEGDENGAFTGADAKGMYASIKEILDLNDATFGQVSVLQDEVNAMAEKLGIALSFLSKSTEEVAADLNKVTTDVKG